MSIRWNNSDLPSEVVPYRVSRFDFNVVGCHAPTTGSSRPQADIQTFQISGRAPHV